MRVVSSHEAVVGRYQLVACLEDNPPAVLVAFVSVVRTPFRVSVAVHKAGEALGIIETFHTAQGRVGDIEVLAKHELAHLDRGAVGCLRHFDHEVLERSTVVLAELECGRHQVSSRQLVVGDLCLMVNQDPCLSVVGCLAVAAEVGAIDVPAAPVSSGESRRVTASDEGVHAGHQGFVSLEDDGGRNIGQPLGGRTSIHQTLIAFEARSAGASQGCQSHSPSTLSHHAHQDGEGKAQEEVSLARK